MDPSIIEILEDDEDETMHSGADVEVFTAALNRDIQGSSSSQPSQSNSVWSLQGGTHVSGQMYSQWQSSSQDESNSLQQHRQHTSENEPRHHNSSTDGQQQQAVQISRQYPKQPLGMQVSSQTPNAIREQGRMHNPGNNNANQPAANSGQARHVPFAVLLPVIASLLDKEGGEKLYALYDKLKKNEIPKEGFVRLMKPLVGDQKLKIALNTIQYPTATNESQVSGQQSTVRIQPSNATQGTGPRSDSHGGQVSQMASSALNNTSREHPTTATQGGFNTQQQQQYAHFPQVSFPMHGSSGAVFHPQRHNSQMRQAPVHQNMVPVNGHQHKSQSSSMPQGQLTAYGLKVKQGSSIAGALMDEFAEKQSSLAHLSSSTPAGANLKTTAPLKKPNEGVGSSPPSSKKQKVSGGFLDQSIELLNDVTAVTGVNLREEEEQLFSGSKEDSRASEASRRFVQEEEERLILQKAPLQKKMEEIMAKCGVKGLGKDVERCLSLCVEERIRGLISNLIKVSKQRVDVEKSRHQTFITSDIRHQILIGNRKAREEWERKQAEEEKLRKLNEPDDTTTGNDGNKEKDDGLGKGLKVNKDEDDKMRTTAANVAARAAVGGDDMQTKWQLLAEARQKREGTNDVPCSFRPGKEIHKPSSGSAKGAKDNQDLDKRENSSALAAYGGTRKHGKNQANAPQTKVARNVTVKDVIAVLEREPQMSKSTLIYRLYDKNALGTFC